MRITPTDTVVVRFIARMSVPFIQLYALYVLGHGDDGPGGGFQGGVLFGASFILYGLAHGWRAGRRHWRRPVGDVLLPGGALLYAAIGLTALLLGGAFLEYAALADAAHHHEAHHLGLLGIEIGVLITVAAAMATLFFEVARPRVFVGKRPRRRRIAG